MYVAVAKKMKIEDEDEGRSLNREFETQKKSSELTAPPTSYSNQLTRVPLRLISNECSFTPSVCSLTFNISSDILVKLGAPL